MSKKTLYALYFILFLVSFIYYPKWKMPGTEATISWDTSGYYWYLPATFIYKDLDKLSFSQEILDKYRCSTHFDQAFDHHSGNKIMKYPAGMALQYLPFFLLAHAMAPMLGYVADGFSLPYQFAIQFGSFLMALIGLWFFRKVLLRFFSETITSLVLVAICLASNYLNFAAIDNAMTHNWLFSWNAILLYATMRFYDKKQYKYLLLMAVSIGISALSRPTEIVSVLIPVFWNLKGLQSRQISAWFSEMWQDFRFLLVAGLVVMGFGFIQLFYYKMVGHEWLIYAYQEQGFSFLHPHVFSYFFSYQTGWLLYNPLFLLLPIGIYRMLRSSDTHWISLLLYAAIFTYIVTSWDYWMYGARAMVQSYPVLGIMLGYAFSLLLENKLTKYALFGILLVFAYYNTWWTHGVHRGAYYDAYFSTKAYFKNSVFRWSVPQEMKKLYDTEEIFKGERRQVNVLKLENFEQDSVVASKGFAGTTGVSDGINSTHEYSTAVSTSLEPNDQNWVRVSADLFTPVKEWDVWKMPQFIVQIKKDDIVVKTALFRVNRLLNEGQKETLHLDLTKPDQYFNKLEFYIWNASSDKELLIDNVVMEEFGG